MMVGELCVLIGTCSFSTSNIAIRRGMRTAHDTGVFISTFVNMVVYLLLIIVLHLNHLLPALTMMGFLLFVLAGLLTTFAGRSLHYAAIGLIGPSRATSFRSSAPVVTILLAFLFLSERFSLSQFIAASGIMGGIWVLSKEVLGRTDLGVVRTPLSDTSTVTSIREISIGSKRSSFIGILFGLGSALSFGIGYLFRKLAVIEVPSPYWGVAIGTTTAWLAMVIQATTKGEIKELCRNNFNLHAPPWFFILAGVLNTIGQLFNYFAVYLIAVSTVIVLASSEPLVTLMISRFMLGGEEPLNWRVIICSGVVCSGVILMIVG